MRKIRVGRGRPLLTMYLPSQEYFKAQWDFRMASYGDNPVSTHWGYLKRDEVWAKLKEIYDSSFNSKEIHNYMTWMVHLNINGENSPLVNIQLNTI